MNLRQRYSNHSNRFIRGNSYLEYQAIATVSLNIFPLFILLNSILPSFSPCLAFLPYFSKSSLKLRTFPFPSLILDPSYHNSFDDSQGHPSRLQQRLPNCFSSTHHLAHAQPRVSNLTATAKFGIWLLCILTS